MVKALVYIILHALALGHKQFLLLPEPVKSAVKQCQRVHEQGCQTERYDEHKSELFSQQERNV